MKISPVWLPSKEEFAEIVKSCNTLTEVLSKLSMSSVGSNFITLKTRIYKEEVNIEHILAYVKNRMIANVFARNKIPLEDILVENSTYKSTALTRRLIKEGVLEEKCYKCGLEIIWNGDLITLQLDHINGIHNDNRIENLRILCPNCHSQTPTYGRKERNPNKCIDCGAIIQKKSVRCRDCNGTGKNIEENKCVECDAIIDRKSDRCRPCAHSYVSKKQMNKRVKILWPENEELVKMVEKLNFVQAGRILGVSDNAIRKRLKRRNLL